MSPGVGYDSTAQVNRLIYIGEMKEILTSYGIHEEISNANMISYRNTRSKVRLPDGDTQLFNITTGVP